MIERNGNLNMKQIKIMSQKYTMEQVPNIEVGIIKLGEVDHLSNAIKICSTLPEDKKKVVLLHEILHVIFQQLGFDEEHDNEHLIDCLSNSLYQVFDDNQELFTLLGL